MLLISYEKAVAELYYSLFGSNPTNFHTLLYRLIGKADRQNRSLLRLGYPIEVLVWEDWQASESDAQFFARFGYKIPVA